MLIDRRSEIDCGILPVLKEVLKKSDFNKFKLVFDFINDKNKNVYNVDAQRYLISCLQSLQFPSSSQEKDNQYNILYYLAQNMPLETNGCSLLNFAIRLGNQQAVKLIISLGADTNYVPSDYPYTPLSAAIQYSKFRRDIVKDRPEMSEFVGSDIDILQSLLEVYTKKSFDFPLGIYPENFPPLTYAKKYHLNEIGSLLISFDANVDILDFSGQPPIMRAVEVNNIDGVKLLLSSGASITENGKTNELLFEIAYTNGYWEILSLLIDYEARLFDK